jgi:hypothetical protein
MRANINNLKDQNLTQIHGEGYFCMDFGLIYKMTSNRESKREKGTNLGFGPEEI